MKLNDYFDKIYCLNLNSREDRLKIFNHKATKLGIEYQRFQGIPGLLIEDYYNLKLNDLNFKIPNKNLLGCALSHIGIMEDALYNNYKRILVLEDDVILHKEINNKLSSMFYTDSLQWDLLYFGFIPLTDDRKYYSYAEIDNLKVSNNVTKTKNFWGMFGYGISENLMKHMTTIYKNSLNIEIDRYIVENIQQNDDFICYGLLPQLVASDDGYSNNFDVYIGNMPERSIDKRYANIEDYI